MWPGMIPILKFSPGEIIPGQLGPIRVTSLSLRYLTTFMVSWTGMPSVIQAITSIPASMDSTIASAANAGGTKIKEALAEVSSTA